VGAPRSHTTGRTHDLSLRLATALFGHAGVEWDISRADDDDRAMLRDWVATVQRFRPLLHSGRTVRVDDTDDGSRLVHGVVAPDRNEALFSLATISSARVAVPPPVRLPGLDPDRSYRVALVPLGTPARTIQDAPPRGCRRESSSHAAGCLQTSAYRCLCSLRSRRSCSMSPPSRRRASALRARECALRAAARRARPRWPRRR
jgi:hypothetical protein